MRKLIWIQLAMAILIGVVYIIIYLGCLLDIKFIIEARASDNEVIETSYAIVDRLSIPFALMIMIVVVNSIVLLRKFTK